MPQPPWKTIAAYGAALAAGTLALQWLDYDRLARARPGDIYTALIAAAFLLLGIYLGIRLFTPPKPPPPPPEPTLLDLLEKLPPPYPPQPPHAPPEPSHAETRSTNPDHPQSRPPRDGGDAYDDQPLADHPHRDQAHERG